MSKQSTSLSERIAKTEDKFHNFFTKCAGSVRLRKGFVAQSLTLKTSYKLWKWKGEIYMTILAISSTKTSEYSTR